MPRFSRLTLLIAIAAFFGIAGERADAATKEVARGRYLVAAIGCGDCHTPGYFLGKPNETMALAGSDVGFAIPKLGVFVAPNLTPDPETGLGKWTKEQIVQAITTGKRPDGRMLAPIMPWRGLAHLTPADVRAIAAYLKSLPPIRHAVPGPFGPDEKIDVFVMSVLPPGAYNSLAAQPQPAPAK
jgi:mono/diheme cytochrome c family protein